MFIYDFAIQNKKLPNFPDTLYRFVGKRGGEVVKKSQNYVDVIYGSPVLCCVFTAAALFIIHGAGNLLSESYRKTVLNF